MLVFASSGAVLVDQYCNPLADVTLEGISAQIDEIAEKVKKMLRIKNPSHPSLRITNGWFSRITSEKNNAVILELICVSRFSCKKKTLKSSLNL